MDPYIDIPLNNTVKLGKITTSALEHTSQ